MKQSSDKILREAIKQGRNKDRLKRFDEEGDTTVRKRGKPPYSYISLIVMAILESPNRRQTLSSIIEHIHKRFPYYGEDCPAKGWKNSIRHNLSLNDCFEKTSRDPANPSKGHFWRLHPRSVHMFEGGSLMRRKRRFRKNASGEHENSSLTSNSDVSIASPHDVNRTPFLDVRVTSYWRKEGSSLLPVVVSTNGTAVAPHLFTDDVERVPYKEAGLAVYSVLPPSSPSRSICLVCAGCTCYY